ncbi:MAG: pilus assembly protein TadG-related protein, partial [Nitrospinota bacterium]
MRSEKGQAIVLYAVSLVGLLGMGGVGVDLGYLYAGQAALQAAVDAGVLGGASGLPDIATAQARAIQMGAANKVFQTPVDL